MKSIFTRKTLWALSFVLVLTASPTLVKGQYTTEEYAAYQAAVEAEPAQRPDDIVRFIEENPESMLVEYAISSYLQLMQEYQNAGSAQQVVELGEKLLTIAPNDLNALYMTSIAAYQTQQFDKATSHGEKVYAEAPDTAGLAFVLASSFSRLGQDEKLIEYGEIAVKELAPADSYQLTSTLATAYAAKKDWENAARHADNTLKGLAAATRPASTPEVEWTKYVAEEKAAAHALLGRRAAESKDWSSTVKHYGDVLVLAEEPAFVAEAHYFIGMARWDERAMEPAMEAFAKGSVQEGSAHAEACRQYLETLYKSTHNDSLAGLDEYVTRVTRN